MGSFKTVNGVPTKVLTFGKNVDDDLSKVKYLVLTIPGNPGVIEYYREFMKVLYNGLQIKYPQLDIPVWGISHAGHQVDDIDSNLFPTLKEHPELYSLEGQYEHKLSFIKSFIPKHIKIIGIGHSIGCKIWLETIKKFTLDNSGYGAVFKCFMLFPTIERMRDTPNGRMLSPLLSFQSLVESCLWPITLLPTLFHKFLIRLYFLSEGEVPSNVVDGTLQLFQFQVFRRFATMGKYELEQVVDLDVATLKSHSDKFFFYFGRTDDWCPLSFVDDMIPILPEMSFKICDQGLKHAFVIKNSSEMANIISDLLVIPNED